MLVTSEPAILYFGTPVVLVSSLNEDGTTNLAPISSAFWLGWRCIFGIGRDSQTGQNLARTGECVLNLPSVDQAAAVDRLALTTGADPVPERKARRGYRHQRDKFARAGLTRIASEAVRPARALECPVQMEAVIAGNHKMAADDPVLHGHAIAFEARILRVHVEDGIQMAGEPNRIDPDKWRPLIMSFQKLYGLGPEQIHPSALSTIPEALYRSPDVDRARRSPVGAEAAAR